MYDDLTYLRTLLMMFKATKSLCYLKQAVELKNKIKADRPKYPSANDLAYPTKEAA